jgi:hypothetical protein
VSFCEPSASERDKHVEPSGEIQEIWEHSSQVHPIEGKATLVRNLITQVEAIWRVDALPDSLASCCEDFEHC